MSKLRKNKAKRNFDKKHDFDVKNKNLVGKTKKDNLSAEAQSRCSEGIYIVIEGQDTTGKSTQVELLADFFRKQNRPVITMHEPNGELEVAHQLNHLIKDKNLNLEPFSHVLHYEIGRASCRERV